MDNRDSFPIASQKFCSAVYKGYLIGLLFQGDVGQVLASEAAFVEKALVVAVSVCARARVVLVV